MSKFYESVSVTVSMKKSFAELRKMYPMAKNYDHILILILYEFQQLLLNPKYRAMSHRTMRKYNEKRIELGLIGIRLPDHIDYGRQIVVYKTEGAK